MRPAAECESEADTPSSSSASGSSAAVGVAASSRDAERGGNLRTMGVAAPMRTQAVAISDPA